MYRTVVSPPLMYEAEIWALEKVRPMDVRSYEAGQDKK